MVRRTIDDARCCSPNKQSSTSSKCGLNLSRYRKRGYVHRYGVRTPVLNANGECDGKTAANRRREWPLLDFNGRKGPKGPRGRIWRMGRVGACEFQELKGEDGRMGLLTRPNGFIGGPSERE